VKSPLVRALAALTLMAAMLAIPGMAANKTTPTAVPGELLPTYSRVVLENGLVLALLEQHELPLVDFQLLLRTGSISDPQGKEGLANITLSLLRKGTQKRTAEQIAEELDFLGAELDLSTSLEFGVVSAQFLAKDVEVGLGLLTDILLRPTFPEAEFDKAVDLAVDELAEAKDNPRTVIGTYFTGFVFAGHPFGRPLGGTETSLPTLTRSDVLRFHDAYVRPNNAILAVVGDFNSKSLQEQVTSAFKKWEKSPVTPASPVAAPQLNGRQVVLIDKPDAVQTYFQIGNIGVAKGDPDEATLDVVNTIFGGRFTSWLMTELRTNTGLSYNAHSRFVQRTVPGTFYISSFTRTADTEKAMDLALEILDRLHKQGVTQEEIASAQNYIRGQFPPNYESAGDLADAITEIEFYGLDRATINEHTHKTDAVTLEQARQAIAKHYPRENLAIVMIGQADSVGTVAAKYGDVRAKKISDPGY